MAKTKVRTLSETDWQLYRAVRLRALEESPSRFMATLAEEAPQSEQFWRDRMVASVRMVAERESQVEGIASMGPSADELDTGEIFGLYVVPDARSTGVSWRLTEFAAALAADAGYRRLFYWVGVDNARAIGFAKNFGFRSTGHRRPSRVSDLDLGHQEIAMVLSLVDDETSVPNPTVRQPRSNDGPSQ